MKDLLPIGSVVLLKDGEKRLMIIGIIQVNPDDGREYDYLACLYPEGFVGPDFTYLFDHEDIDRIDAKGFTDEEHDKLRAKLAELLVNHDVAEHDAFDPEEG